MSLTQLGYLNEPKLRPEDWFDLQLETKSSLFLTPPLAAGETIVKQVGKFRLRRLNSMYMIAIPRLMIGLWQKELTGKFNAYFVVPSGSPIWSTEMYEPLMILFVFLFMS